MVEVDKQTYADLYPDVKRALAAMQQQRMIDVVDGWAVPEMSKLLFELGLRKT